MEEQEESDDDDMMATTAGAQFQAPESAVVKSKTCASDRLKDFRIPKQHFGLVEGKLRCNTCGQATFARNFTLQEQLFQFLSNFWAAFYYF